MRQPSLHDATRSVLTHFAARAMLSSRAPRRFRARNIQEAWAYGMNARMVYEMKKIEGVGSAHLDVLSDGVWRASVGNVESGPTLVVRG